MFPSYFVPCSLHFFTCSPLIFISPCSLDKNFILSLPPGKSFFMLPGNSLLSPCSLLNISPSPHWKGHYPCSLLTLIESHFPWPMMDMIVYSKKIIWDFWTYPAYSVTMVARSTLIQSIHTFVLLKAYHKHTVFLPFSEMICIHIHLISKQWYNYESSSSATLLNLY